MSYKNKNKNKKENLKYMKQQSICSIIIHLLYVHSLFVHW